MGICGSGRITGWLSRMPRDGVDVSPHQTPRRNIWTDPDASPELGSGLFLICLLAAVAAVLLLTAFGLWVKTL